MTDATATTTPRSPRTIAVDNFLRRALRVGDPRDPAQVAAALLQRYPEEADRDLRERTGQAYSTLPFAVATAAGGIAALAELAQAKDDLERDTQALISASEFKDIRVELSGWGRAIRKIAEDGLAAARFALDSTRHAQALAARSQLIAFARLARYVGALSCSSEHFRRLAQSCDIFAGLILVGLGEGLAASGITRGTALLRVAGAELQARRNAVITALRSLSGSVDSPLGQEEWPRGMEAYRRLISSLDESGRADLRPLLEETALTQAMDELVDLSAGANINGLRELATASALLVDRFQRLIRQGQVLASTIGSAESPPLVTFTSALQLFVDAFASSAGNRLLYIARPPIILYGLYGGAGADKGAQRLIKLTMLRGTLLELIDCYACCNCEDGGVRCQVLLDFLLFMLDRAIDAYAVGSDADGAGDPEQRAAAFGVLFGRTLGLVATTTLKNTNVKLCELETDLQDQLEEIRDTLLEAVAAPADPVRTRDLMIQELRMAFHAEAQTERLVRALSPACQVAGLFNLELGQNPAESLVRASVRFALDQEWHVGVDLPPAVKIPPTPASSLADIANDWSGQP